MASRSCVTKQKNLIIFCKLFMPTELIRKQFLLTEEENQEIEQIAESKGLSVSNLTRMLHGLEPLKKGVVSKKAERNFVERKQIKTNIKK